MEHTAANIVGSPWSKARWAVLIASVELLLGWQPATQETVSRALSTVRSSAPLYQSNHRSSGLARLASEASASGFLSTARRKVLSAVRKVAADHS